MRCLSVFTGLLLVVKFVENISGSSISTETGRSPMLEGSYHDGDLVQCTTEHNGVFYNFYPDTNSTFLDYTGDGRLCELQIINVDFTHSGEWKINTILKTDEYDYEEIISSKQISHFLHVQGVGEMLPAAKISGEDGSYATLYFKEGFDDVTKLYIASNENYNNTSYVLGENGNGTSAGLEIYGQHGLRIPVDETWSGRWKLIEESGDYKTLIGYFDIHWTPKKISSEQIHIKWNLGEVNKQVTAEVYPRQSYVEIERPDGEIISLKNTQGIYAVEKVSEKHAGIWKARYLSKTSMDIQEREINVTVVDPQAINVMVTTTDDYAIHMLCKTNVNTIRFCQFTSPNGTEIHMIQGIGNDKYEFFGSGYGTTGDDTDECGLTIRHPTFDDYGLWKCTLTESLYSKDVLSAYVSTDNLREKNSRPLSVTAEDIYVKRGDKFSITCSTRESLDYCWIRSPNGTNYSVRKLTDADKHTPNTLSYFGEGLSVGVCGATIENANDTDAGDWSCRLGVTGGGEKESTVAVTVTESYITPIREVINLAYDEPKLVIKLLPNVEATIRYCRWVRPDGHGFHQERAERYSRTRNIDTCSLSVKDWSSEDIGTWSCYVRLSTGTDEELHTTVELVYGTATVASNMAMNIIVICLVGTTILTACILGYIFHKKRMTRPSDPPAYFNEFDTSKHFPIPVTEKNMC